MKRGLALLAAVCLVGLAGCTGASGTPTPVVQTASPTSSASGTPNPSDTSATPGTSPTPASPSTSDTTAASTGAVDDPALDRCDDLAVLPCARQVNRVTVAIAGSSIALVYSSDRQPGRTVDAAPAAANVGLGGWSLTNLPGYDPATKREYLPDGTVRTVTGVTQGDLTAVADPSGTTVTTFDAQGRASATLDAVTGLPVARFGWDEHGLATVTDASGATLTIRRDSTGALTSMQATGTSPMTFAVSDGQLAAVGYPDGSTVHLDGGAGGLLSDIVDASGLRTAFGYDTDGRLTSRSDPTGITTTYARHVADGTATVVTSTDGGVVGTDTVSGSGEEATFTHTDATGVTTKVVADPTTRTITAATRSTTVTLSPDPRWGADAPVPTKVVVSDGSGGGPSTGTTRATQGTTTTSTVTVDGRIWTYAYDSTTRTTTVTDPNGASRATAVDERGRVVTTMVQGVPVSYAYDDNGRVTRITVGTGTDARTWTYAYAPGSITVTDPMGNSTRETVGSTGLVTGVAGPNGTGYTTTLDTAGRITGFAERGAGTYTVTWGANDLPAVENAPAGQGPPQFTSTTYDATGQAITRATSHDTVTYGRDAAGRVTTVDAGGNSSIAFSYDSAGRLATAATSGVTLTQAYTGSALTTSSTALGEAKTEIARTTDGLGRTTSLTVNGGASISYSYDPAGNVTTAGAMTITRDPSTGWITTKKLGALTETLRYNQFGEPTTVTVTGPSGPIATITQERDHLGRVTSRTTTTGSTHRTTAYRYDAAGRLVGETIDGRATTYGYDTAGNLISIKSPTGTTTNTYDARNSLLRSGSTSYTYDGWGRLATAKGPDGTTTYHYDALGNLTGVDRPGKPAITYTLDGLGRRVASASGGSTSAMIAYIDPIRPAATFTATGALDELFVYDGDLQPADINDGGGPLPAYLTKGGTAYLELPDVTGGPALVIDSETGAIADSVDRTAVGQLRSETDPGFQLIGYAGGIADPATGLVKIGARDYDTATGRWTAPDPLGMAGGSANLYTYVSGDPVNRTDPRGTCDYVGLGISGSAGLGPVAGGGGVGIAWAGGQFGTYSTISGGGGLVGDLGIGITVTCLDSDNGDKSLGNFSGPGSSVEGTFGPVSGGSDKGYGPDGNQSSHGGHGTASLGGGAGGSAQGSLTSIVCLTGCPPPGPTVCGDLGCDSSPGKSPDDPGSGSGSGGIPTSGPRSTGDPHIRTADGSRYDLMAVGEFVWAETDSGDLVVQIRQQPLTGTRTISINTAIAMLVDGDKVQVAPPPTPDQPVAMSVVGAVLPPVGTFTLPGGSIVMRTPSLTTVTAKDSTEFWIRMNPSGLDIVAAFPDALKGKVHGLVGPFTGTDTQKVETSAGKSIAVTDLSDYATLYRTFADSWRIAQADSLFTDRPGKDATAFDDPTFPDRVPPAVPADEAAAAKAACAAAGLTGTDLTDCQFDVGNTGDAGYATAMTASSGVVPGAATSGSGGGAPTGTVSGDIVPGKTVAGKVAGNAHTDLVFTVPANTVGYFAADPACDQAASGALTWNLMDATGGTLVGSSVICSDLGRVVFASAGSYRVVVTNSGTVPVEFRITWEESRPDQTKPLRAGQTASGTIDKPGAQDIWTMTVAAGTVAYLAADPSCDESSEFGITWNVMDSTGATLVGTSYICSDLGRIVFDKAGTYHFVVASAGGKTGAYSVTWEESRPDQTKPLQPGQTASGTIDKPGAQDIWTMTVAAGTVAYLAADPSCDESSEFGITWNVMDSTGATLVGTSYICSDMGRIVFDKAGTYHLVVASAGGKTGAYSVTWEESRPDQTKPLQPGQTASGTIDKPGAQDIWTMTVSAATEVNLLADPSCDSATADAMTWSVVAADGSSVVGSSYICGDLGAVKLPAAGTYNVRVSSNAGGTGSYSFRWAS